jgi:hypothetical protein
MPRTPRATQGAEASNPTTNGVLPCVVSYATVRETLEDEVRATPRRLLTAIKTHEQTYSENNQRMNTERRTR